MNRSVSSAHRLLLSLTALTTCLGCGSGLDLVPTPGVVQHEGTPLSTGKVLFLPLGQGKAAIGPIQEDGSFSLMTLQPGDGAVPDRYRVTVVADLKLEGEDSHVTCTHSKFSLEVESVSENVFEINVSKADDWQVVVDN